MGRRDLKKKCYAHLLAHMSLKLIKPDKKNSENMVDEHLLVTFKEQYDIPGVMLSFSDSDDSFVSNPEA